MDRLRAFRISCLVIVCALVVQYALGMYVNLFVQFPTGASDGQLWEFAWSQPPLAAHIILAILLLLAAIVLCVRAILIKERRRLAVSLLGLAAILAAGASGASFIPSQTDLLSYSMALWFLVAIAAYGRGYFLA